MVSLHHSESPGGLKEEKKKKVKLSEWTFAIDYKNVLDMCVGKRGGWTVGSCMIY